VQALLEACPGVGDPEEAIRQRARALVDQARALGWSGPPFDPELLAELRGIKVRPSGHELHQDALIRLSEHAQMEIVWNQNRARTRSRFSICHEISHTFFPDCFEEVRYRECTSDDPGRRDVVEQLCDVGAAELLMPAAAFAADLAPLSISCATMDVLRERYQASREAVAIRMIQLSARPCAVAFLSDRLKPAERRSLSQRSFAFVTAPEPRLRTDFMVTSRTFGGKRLPKHRSVPNGSALYRVLNDSPGTASRAAAVRGVELWPAISARPLEVEAAEVPGPSSQQRRVVVFLAPAE
jgi:Zn-dependent peptidase ImmA (M78 family)